MADDAVTGKNGGELNSWKEIAEYLNTTVRTAQRWETEKRLPVRRLSGVKGRVVASVAEIDEWKRRDALQQERVWNNPKWLRLYAAALSAVILAGAGILGAKYLSRNALGSPAAFQWHDRQIVILDHNGHRLWTHTFPSPMGLDSTAAFRGFVQYVDLNGNGSVETLITYAPSDHFKSGDEIYCFSETGEVLWRFAPGRVVQDRNNEFYPPYHFKFLRTLASPESPQERWIVATSIHHLSYPSQLVLLDAQGKIRGEYWHPGHMDSIEIADVDGQAGDEILVAGENRHEGKATVVILDPQKLASLPSTPPRAIEENPGSTEIAVLFFPRTMLNLRLEEVNHVARVQWTGDVLEVQVEEARVQRPSSDLNYVFDHKLNLKAIHPWDTIRSSYKDVFGPPEAAAKLFEGDLDRMRREVVAEWR